MTVASLLAAVAISLFSCGGNSSGGQKLTTISMWYIPSQSEAGEPPEDWFVFEKLRKTLGIDLKLKALPSDTNELEAIILQAARTNSLPDIFRTSRIVMVELAKQNKITNVDKMFPLMPERTREIYTEDARKAGAIDGLTFSLSYPTSNTNIPKNEGILIRKDWLDRLGLSIPKTTDEFLAVMQAFTTNDPDGNGKNDTYGFGAFIEQNVMEDALGKRFSPIFGAFGVCGTFNYDKQSPLLNIHKPEYFEALSYIKNMVVSKVIDPNWYAYSKDDFRNAWKSGQFGIMREQFAAFSLKSNYAAFDKNFPDGEWIVIDPPVGPAGKSAVGVNAQSWNYLSISKRAAELGKLPLIAKMLEWFYTDAYADLWYGQEGVNYTVDVASGKITDKVSDPTKSYTSVESKPLLQLRWLVDHNNPEALRERYPTWTTQNGKEMNTLEILHTMQSKNWIEGYSFSAMNNDLRKQYRQGILDFVLGKRNLTRENWDAFVRELDDNGLKDWENETIEYSIENGLL